MNTIKAILIGAGDRGANAYASYALNNPGTVQFVAVAEKSEERREHFQKVHGIPDERAFESWEDVFKREKFADAVLICTNESYHYGPAKAAMDRGYAIMLEKPITPTAKQSVEIGDLAQSYDKAFILCYVLRYTPFFTEIKRVIDSGAIGRVQCIVHCEHVGLAHYSHSYVRGVFAVEAESGPVILGKCCHDMDVLNWLADSKCVRLSSYSTEGYFSEKNAPPGAPARCTDGCPHAEDCYFYAPKLYFAPRSGFNVDTISLDTSPEGKMRALREGMHGRCVYRCDNDLAETQAVNMEYENGVIVSFSMTPFTQECYRSLHITGTKGEIVGNLEENAFTVRHIPSGRATVVNVSTVADRHSGGDYYIMTDFLRMVREGRTDGRTAVRNAVDSHVMCFAAEKSRRLGIPVVLEEFKSELRGAGD